jgi:hypothetical protein
LGHTGGKPLLELNRLLRPGGYYIWSATPVYRKDKRDIEDWNGLLKISFHFICSTQIFCIAFVSIYYAL